MASIFTAVISNYAPRGELGVNNLIHQLSDKVNNIIVVVNNDLCHQVQKNILNDVVIINRPNTGMNIGAWSEAIAHCKNSDYVLFLQDECKLVRPDFVECYRTLLSEPGIGMIGESINPNWNCEWSQIAKSKLNYSINYASNQTITRVNYYLECMIKWGINPGTHSTHLRGLAWAFNKLGLQAIEKFPIGLNKEQCIAAEISVSRKIIQSGLKFKQSNLNSFNYFEHKEWKKNGFSKKQFY